jgi:ligand-binding sensor domain-containing protein
MAGRGNPVAVVAAAPKDSAPAPAATAAPRDPGDSSEEALAFSAPAFEPVGLAYDVVSRRFIVGDRNAGRLVVIDELSHHVTTLVSAASAGFYDAITAFEIDSRRGDLWVASVKDTGPDSVLHKLQLVSGRVLEQIRIGTDETKSRIADLAVAADGTILVLDSDGARILRLPPGSRRLDETGRIAVPKGARSFTLAGERVLYVASDEGISRIDLQTKETSKIRIPRDADLSRIEKIRWHDGGLVLVERTSGGHQIERARLDAAGQSITRLQTLPASGGEDPRAVTLSGTVIYYLVGAKGESSIRRARLR